MILSPQNRRHTMRIAAGIVNLAQGIICRHRDMHAPLDRRAVRFLRAIPDSGEGEYWLIVQVNATSPRLQ
jgi:hypothetical protein